MKKLLVFACKPGRPRDIPLLRAGARAAGFRFLLVLVPFAYPVLLLAALARWLGAQVAVVISDRFAGDAWLARRFGKDCVRMLWNYADEFPQTLTTPPAARVCFFDDPAHDVRRFCFAPQPGASRLNAEARRAVCFVGDVGLDATLPMGIDWWRAQFAMLRDAYGYGFYLTPAYEALLGAHLDRPLDVRQARVLCKNLIRLWCVQSARAAFGDRLLLVGSNWRRFGLEALPSAYSLEARLQYYADSAAHLDCGSKSGDSALYPRASEIISYGGAPIQLVCLDSVEVYGTRIDEFAFASEAALHALIEQRLTEPPPRRLERAAWLAAHLERSRLTMAESFRTLFETAAAPSAARAGADAITPSHRD